MFYYVKLTEVLSYPKLTEVLSYPKLTEVLSYSKLTEVLSYPKLIEISRKLITCVHLRAHTFTIPNVFFIINTIFPAWREDKPCDKSHGHVTNVGGKFKLCASVERTQEMKSNDIRFEWLSTVQDRKYSTKERSGSATLAFSLGQMKLSIFGHCMQFT